MNKPGSATMPEELKLLNTAEYANQSDYGSEIDLKVSYNFLKHYTVAGYYADEYKQVTDKLWLELVVNF